MRIESSTVRDGIAARVVDRHADETRRVRVTRIKLSRDEAMDFEAPTAHEVNAPRALRLLDIAHQSSRQPDGVHELRNP